jgi:hypothetical protein
VKTVVQRALTAEVRVFDYNADDEPVDGAKGRVAEVSALDKGAELTRMLSALQSDGAEPHRAGGRFVVEHWHCVQVVEGHAKVFVSGHDAYVPTASNAQQRDETAQYELLLTHEHGGWFLTRERAALAESP